ncbi:MAG: hypothetical protein HY778_11200 [Betaproteobacteria bacterium]|nr:hypothetical protein [Betaproteobacteria bacterium]
MKIVLAVVALIVVVLAAVLLSAPQDSGQAGKPIADLPWHIDTLPDGNSRVFGLTLGASTLAEARDRFGRDMQLAVIAAPGETGSLEAYYDQIDIGPLTGRMILTADLDRATVEALRSRAAKSDYMESSTRRHTLAAADLPLALGAPIGAIAFIPSAQLDADTAMQRFGTPAQRVRITGHVEQLLYPDKGLAVTLDAKGKEVLQYVAPRQFAERLHAPLESAPAEPGAPASGRDAR